MLEKQYMQFTPSEFQSPLTQQIISSPSDDYEEFDVVIVGAGPAGLSAAIHMVQLAKSIDIDPPKIAVVEKAEKVSNHNLSGAIINPSAFGELFPDISPNDLPFARPAKNDKLYYLTNNKAIPLPVPPLMNNSGNFVASICEVVRWLADRAEELGIMILPGFPATSLIIENQKVIGIRTAERNLDQQRAKLPNYQPGMDIRANITLLSEGTRGRLSQGFFSWQNLEGQNPQIYAVGVKELWETNSAPTSVIHTMGWPLGNKMFGGGFMYPMSPTLVSLGLVMGLDNHSGSFDPHYLLQEMKTHPFYRRVLNGGSRIEWGAKTIPEGGYYSIPTKLSGNGIMVLGDSAGFVNVPTLKGIHYAMHSGILAARTAISAIKSNDYSSSSLNQYDDSIKKSFINSDLHLTRNMRHVFRKGLFRGIVSSALIYLMRGWWPHKHIVQRDSDIHRVPDRISYVKPDGKVTFNKADSLGVSGNVTPSNMPQHLSLPEDVPQDVARFYANLCPAEVYEVSDAGELKTNPSNCIDCMTTDILAARWSPRQGGSGARYRRM